MALSYEELTSWSQPKVSGGALVVCNLMYILLYVVEYTFNTVLLYITLASLILMGAAHYGMRFAQIEEPSCMKRDNCYECVEGLAESMKQCFVWLSRQYIRVCSWEDVHVTLSVALACYLLLLVSEYSSTFFLVLVKINFDFLLGAKRSEIEAIACPKIEKLKVLGNQVYEKIPRAKAVKKED